MVRHKAGLSLTILGTFVALLGGATVTLAQPPAPATLRATLTAAKSKYFIGEDVVVNYCIENPSATTFDVLAMPDYGFRSVVTNATGVVMPRTRLVLGSGIMQWHNIAPRGKWCRSFSLMQFVRIDRSDDYTVSASIEFELRSGSELTRGSGPEAQTTVTLSMPTEAEAEGVLASLEALQPSASNVGDTRNQYGGVVAYPAPYLLPLRKRAEAGDVNAVTAIAGMPLPGATRALIDLTAHPLPSVARAATFSLPARLPPAFAGVLGIQQIGGALQTLGGFGTDADLAAESWRSDFTADVRILAKKLLTSVDPVEVRAGAFMIAAVGVQEDVPDVAAALSRTIAQAPSLPLAADGWSQPRGVSQELQRAATALVGRGYTPMAPGQTSGDVVLWLAALGRGGRPSGWEASLGQALKHEALFVREVALEHMPVPVPDALVPFVAAGLGSPDVTIQVAACGLADRAKLSELVAPLVEAFRGAADARVLNACGNALHTLGARMALLDIAAARLADQLSGQLSSDFLSWLYGVFEVTSGGGGQSATPGQARALSTRWQQFLAAHRADIMAGKRWFLDDPAVTADLVPPGWSFSRPGKQDWPPR